MGIPDSSFAPPPLRFDRFGDGWQARFGNIRVYVDGEHAAPHPIQAAAANHVAASLADLRDRASRYLDLFVDRGKACGDPDEPWWLDEIEFRRAEGAPGNGYLLLLTLDGDDGGMWTVEMRLDPSEHRPIRFERAQG